MYTEIKHIFCKKTFTYIFDNKVNIDKILSLTKNQMGKYLNIWFPNIYNFNNIDNLIVDQLISVKKVDDITMYRLSWHRYVPIVITICPFIEYSNDYKTKKVLHNKFNLKVELLSDESSYFIAVNKKLNYDKAINIRYKLIHELNYYNKKNKLNGDDLLKKCINLGFDKKSITFD